MSQQTQFIVLHVSAGFMEDGTAYAGLEVINPYPKSTGIKGNIQYGSPAVKLKLVDRSTGKPNVELARKIEQAGAYLQIVNFEGVWEVGKVKGIEQMTFTILDAEFPHLDINKKAS